MSDSPENIQINEKEKVVFRVLVGRHGEKGERGQLTEWDIKPVELGQNLGPKTKTYSSSMSRSIQTARKILKGAESSYTNSVKYELSSASLLPPEFNQALKKNYEEGFEKVLTDDRACSYAASGLAARLDIVRRISGQVNPEERVNLPHITHDLDIASLLKQCMIRERDGQTTRGFNQMEDIGGPFKTNENLIFDLTKDLKVQRVKIEFTDSKRAQVIGEAWLDLVRVAQLAEIYKQRVAVFYR